MTAVDWMVVAVLGLSSLLGVWRGLVKELLSLVSWAVAFWVAQKYAGLTADWLPMSGSSSMLRYVAGFVVLFITVLIVAAVLAWLIQQLLSAVGLSGFDRLLGVVFGALRGMLILCVITWVVNMTPMRESEAWQQAQARPWLNWGLQVLKPALPADFGKYISSCVESSAWSVTHLSIS
jgi:membrane protein required for colicin V production